jgi:hypothetical protein
VNTRIISKADLSLFVQCETFYYSPVSAGASIHLGGFKDTSLLLVDLFVSENVLRASPLVSVAKSAELSAAVDSIAASLTAMMTRQSIMVAKKELDWSTCSMLFTLQALRQLLQERAGQETAETPTSSSKLIIWTVDPLPVGISKELADEFIALSAYKVDVNLCCVISPSPLLSSGPSATHISSSTAVEAFLRQLSRSLVASGCLIPVTDLVTVVSVQNSAVGFSSLPAVLISDAIPFQKCHIMLPSLDEYAGMHLDTDVTAMECADVRIEVDVRPAILQPENLVSHDYVAAGLASAHWKGVQLVPLETISSSLVFGVPLQVRLADVMVRALCEHLIASHAALLLCAHQPCDNRLKAPLMKTWWLLTACKDGGDVAAQISRIAPLECFLTDVVIEPPVMSEEAMLQCDVVNIAAQHLRVGSLDICALDSGLNSARVVSALPGKIVPAGLPRPKQAKKATETIVEDRVPMSPMPQIPTSSAAKHSLLSAVLGTGKPSKSASSSSFPQAFSDLDNGIAISKPSKSSKVRPAPIPSVPVSEVARKSAVKSTSQAPTVHPAPASKTQHIATHRDVKLAQPAADAMPDDLDIDDALLDMLKADAPTVASAAEWKQIVASRKSAEKSPRAAVNINAPAISVGPLLGGTREPVNAGISKGVRMLTSRVPTGEPGEVVQPKQVKFASSTSSVSEALVDSRPTGAKVTRLALPTMPEEDDFFFDQH